MIIYQALYCSCIHESSYATLSLHKTKKGAEIAMNFHKMEVYKEYEEIYDPIENKDQTKHEFVKDSMKHEAWSISELTLEE